MHDIGILSIIVIRKLVYTLRNIGKQQLCITYISESVVGEGGGGGVGGGAAW